MDGEFIVLHLGHFERRSLRGHMGFNTNGADFNLDLESSTNSPKSNALVAVGGKLPHCFQTSTSKLLDVLVALAPGYRKLDAKGKK